MTQPPPPGEEEFLQLWEDEGFRIATRRDEEKLDTYFEELADKLTVEQARAVRSRIEQRLVEIAPAILRARQSGQQGR